MEPPLDLAYHGTVTAELCTVEQHTTAPTLFEKRNFIGEPVTRDTVSLHTQEAGTLGSAKIP